MVPRVWPPVRNRMCSKSGLLAFQRNKTFPLVCRFATIAHSSEEAASQQGSHGWPKVNRKNSCDVIVILNPASGRDPDARPVSGVEFIRNWMIRLIDKAHTGFRVNRCLLLCTILHNFGQFIRILQDSIMMFISFHQTEPLLRGFSSSRCLTKPTSTAKRSSSGAQAERQ